MHELSLANSLIAQLLDLLKEHQANRVIRVSVTIGPFSGIVRDSFEFGFDALKRSYSATQEAVLEVQLEALGIGQDETYQVAELFTGKRELWRGASAVVRLTPEAPAAIWSVHRFLRSEASFDYFQ